MKDINQVVLAMLATFFDIAGITFIGLGTVFFVDDLRSEELFGPFFGLRAPIDLWQLGGVFMIVCLLALIANLLAFPEESSDGLAIQAQEAHD